MIVECNMYQKLNSTLMYGMYFYYNPIYCNYYLRDFFIYFHFICMDVLPPHISVDHLHVWCLSRPGEDVGSPATG